MFMTFGKDSYGHNEIVTADKLRHILDLLDEYMKGEEYSILEIRCENVTDKNGRIDIEIQRGPILQKLLILKDEVIDGAAFHARRSEWYD